MLCVCCCVFFVCLFLELVEVVQEHHVKPVFSLERVWEIKTLCDVTNGTNPSRRVWTPPSVRLFFLCLPRYKNVDGETMYRFQQEVETFFFFFFVGGCKQRVKFVVL